MVQSWRGSSTPFMNYSKHALYRLGLFHASSCSSSAHTQISTVFWFIQLVRPLPFLGSHSTSHIISTICWNEVNLARNPQWEDRKMEYTMGSGGHYFSYSSPIHRNWSEVSGGCSPSFSSHATIFRLLQIGFLWSRNYSSTVTNDVAEASLLVLQQPSNCPRSRRNLINCSFRRPLSSFLLFLQWQCLSVSRAYTSPVIAGQQQCA